MTEIPAHLLKAFSSVDQRDISAWWEKLDEPHRLEVTRLCDTRADSCFFGIVSDETELPEVEGGLDPEEEEVKPVEEWEIEYFDHLMAHPELVFCWDLNLRTFHTGCTAHEEARGCWKRMEVAGDFKCPFARADCVMKPFRGRRLKRVYADLNPRTTRASS